MGVVMDHHARRSALLSAPMVALSAIEQEAVMA